MTRVLANEPNLTALDHVPIGVFVLRHDWVVTFWNRRLEEWNGLGRDQILGTSIVKHFPHFADAKYVERLGMFLVGGAPLFFSSQLHHQIIPSDLPNGAKRIQHTTVTAIPASSNDTSYALFAIQDVTDLAERIDDYWQMRDRAEEQAAERALAQELLQRANEQLEDRVSERTAELSNANYQLRREIAERKQAEDQLHEKEFQLAHVARLSTMGELVAAIAHEVNQPLYAIANFAAAARRTLEAKEEQPRCDLLELNRQIAEEALRAGHIIKQLRAFVRKSDGVRSAVDINGVVRDSVGIMSPMARRARATVHLELVTLPAVVHVDRIQIEQVLVNLVRNALEAVASSDSRQVTIRTSLTQEQACISVRDTGDGIPDSVKAKLFDAFFTTKESGLGMGLAISRTIVEAHNGRIWVDTTCEGGAIHLSLPLYQATNSS